MSAEEEGFDNQAAWIRGDRDGTYDERVRAPSCLTGCEPRVRQFSLPDEEMRMRTVLKSKIHRATVTQADLHYEGSITLDPDLLEAADILPFEQVHVVDVDNGTRLTTYAIEGERGSGQVCINGAAARLVSAGDIVIILAYDSMSDAEARAHQPALIYVDGANHIVRRGHSIAPVPALAGGVR